MSDYISKSAIIEEIKKQKDDNDMHCRLCMDAMIEIAEELPTVDEKEIIRKYAEQIIDKMKVLLDLVNMNQRLSVMQAMDIVKEECEINE